MRRIGFRWTRRLARVAAGCLLVCGAVLAQDRPATPEPKDTVSRSFKELDTNGDGKLSPEELKAAPLIARLVQGADQDGDGSITLAEARAHLRRQSMKKLLTQSVEDPSIQVSPRQGPTYLKPAEAGVGAQVANLQFKDIDGKAYALQQFAKAPGVVLALTSTSCPISKKYAPALARLEQELGKRGVAFIWIDPIATDSPDELREQAKRLGLQGPCVHDRDGAIIAALQARSTGEAFLLDPTRTVVYRGAVDDQYGLGYSLPAPREQYLRDAAESLLAGGAIRIRATEAPGCTLEPATPKQATPVTYHGQVARIVQEHCLECHRAGGGAPFSLESPEQLIAHQAMIRKVVEKGTMPPWFAAPPKPGEHSPWANDRSLTAREKQDLLGWLKSDRPLGDPADAPKPRTYPKEWKIGTPDKVVQLPHAVSIPAEGVMEYQNLIVETDLAEDRWIQALEIRPTAREVVHHVLVFVLPPGQKFGPNADERQGFFAAYVPGNSSFIYPAGLAKFLPKGARLCFQMHYTPNGTATKDRTQLGLVFAKEKPRHEVQVIGLAEPRLRIPPNADHHPETATMPVPADAKILAFMPHMHVRGKAFRYELITPGKPDQTLLDVPAYDFNWQLAYRYADPVIIPSGSTLKATAWYDNSSKNPANPDPNKLVRWGPQTFDEMMLGYVEYYFPKMVVK